MNQALMTPDEFVKMVPVGKSTLYRYIRKGEVPSVKICGRIFIPAEYVQTLLKKSM